jgi:hypothetical protein
VCLQSVLSSSHGTYREELALLMPSTAGIPVVVADAAGSGAVEATFHNFIVLSADVVANFSKCGEMSTFKR